MLERSDRLGWLFMVYMQAGDTSQLDSLAVQDLLEMEAGLSGKPPTDGDVEVFVQIRRRWPGVPQRYRIRPRLQDAGEQATSVEPGLATIVEGPDPSAKEGGELVGPELVDMGTRRALADFLKAGLRIEADHYCLVLWGHAFGLGFGRDHNNPLTLSELRLALTDCDRKLDVLATNACTMSYIEAAVELHERVTYLVASQMFVPLTGLPYRSILTTIGADTTPAALSRTIVDHYVREFASSPSGEPVAMSVLELAQTPRLGQLLNDVARNTIAVMGEGPTTNFDRLAQVRDAFLANPAGDVRPVLDLASLASELTELCAEWVESGADAGTVPSPRVRAQAQTSDRDDKPGDAAISKLSGSADALRDAVAPPEQRDGNEDQMRDNESASGPAVVHAGSTRDLEDLHGVGVFAPFVVDRTLLKELELDDKDGRKAYEKLRIFSGDNTWVSLVYDRLRLDEPDEIVDNTGVVRPRERVQVNQLAIAVEAAFNKLDRLLDAAERRVVAELSAGPPDVAMLFGPPRLKLCDLSKSDRQNHAAVETAEAPDKVSPSPTSAAATGDRDWRGRDPVPIVSWLSRIEQALQAAEKTTRRVVTNGTFGLGPPGSSLSTGPKSAGDVFGPKSAGDVFGPKSAGDVFGPKSAGDVFGPKSAGDVFGAPGLGGETGQLLAFLASDSQISVLPVSTLFRHVAVALVQLEQAVSLVERVVLELLPPAQRRLSPPDYRQIVSERCGKAFAIAKETTLQARRTIRGALAHPIYGLGPGPEKMGHAQRDAIASAAGLSRRNLVLL